MRIPRRSLAVTVVLGAAIAACFEAEHLSTTAQRTMVLSPGNMYSFGNVDIGTGSATNPDPYFLFRANSGTDDDFITSIDLVQPGCGSDFGLDLQPPLPTSPAEVYCMGSSTGSMTAGFAPLPQGTGPGGCLFIDYQFGAFFHPSQPNMQTCQVNVTSHPKSSATSTITSIMLSGTGTAPSFSMTALPTPVNFGDLPFNTTSGAQTVAVTNTGGTQIHVGGMNSDPAHFIVNPSITGPYPIDQSLSQTFSVSCQTGASAATYSGTLTFFTSSSEGSLMQQVMLSCSATATSVLVMPNPVNLGTHLMGDSPTTVPVSIKNTSATPVMLDNFSFSAQPAGEVTYAPLPTGPINVNGNTSTTVNVRYAPTTERDFGSLGTMVFTVNGTSTSVPLVGGAHVGSIGTNPASLDFGAVCAGSTSQLDLTIFANAGGDVTLGDPAGPAAPFMASLPATGRNLLAHHANEIKLTATAAPLASTSAGDHMDQIQLQTNIPAMGSVPIGVHALVLAGGVTPSPSLVHFGPNDIGKPSTVQMVTLTNCGAGPLTLTDVSFIGMNADEFAVVSPADVHVTIPTTMSQQFLVVMNAKTAGAKSAQMMFSFPGGPQMVDLDGTGLGSADTGGTKDRETYYACSTGVPSGLAPVAFAALLLRRRRRR